MRHSSDHSLQNKTTTSLSLVPIADRQLNEWQQTALRNSPPSEPTTRWQWNDQLTSNLSLLSLTNSPAMNQPSFRRSSRPTRMGNTQPVIGAVHVKDATDGRRSIKATQSYAGKLQIIGDHSAIIRNSDKVHGILNEAESQISSLGLRVRFTAEEWEQQPTTTYMQTEAKTARTHHQSHHDDQQTDTQRSQCQQRPLQQWQPLWKRRTTRRAFGHRCRMQRQEEGQRIAVRPEQQLGAA